MDDLASALNTLGLQESQRNESKKKELIQTIKDKIFSGHTCNNWYQNLPPISDDELKNTLETYTHEFEDFAQRRDENESDLKYSCIETLSKRCIQALIYIHLKDYDEVPAVASEAYKLIQYCINEKYFSQDYAEGFRYVVKALEIYLEIENGSMNKAGVLELQKYLDGLESFDELSQKNRVGVFALKQYFIGNMSRVSYVDQITVIREMIRLDPTNCEWHCCLYIILRFYRETFGKYLPPSIEERKAIQEAVKVRGAKSDPRILMGEIMCIAEILKNELNGVVSTPFRFGKRVFYSTDEVVIFIRSQADEILSIDPMSVRSNINIAKIFSSTLPFDLQDKSFAKICMKRALLFHPNSSKANHRMAVFYLSSRQLPKARKYLKRAYEADKRNRYALMDLLRLYMQDVNKNAAELSSLFNETLASGYFRKFPRIISDLLFTRAVYTFLCGKPNEAIEFIVQAYTIDEKTTEYFEDIGRSVSRFKWYENIQGKNILGVIVQMLSSAYGQCRDGVRKAKLLKLHEAARDAEQKSRDNYSRGGRGGGRGRAGFGSHSENRGGYGENRGYGDHRGGFGGQRGGFGDSRGGNARGGFRGKGPNGPDDFSFRGGFYKNTDSGHSRSNTYNNKNEWRGGTKSEGQSNKEQGGSGDDGKNARSFHNSAVDNYTLLGVAKTATKSEIKKAYFKLARECHPDKNSHLPQEEILKKQEYMKRINKAWEVLQNSF